MSPILTHNGKVLKYRNPKQITVTNGGGIGTTDWVDSNLDGLGDNWAKVYTLADVTFSIVTGNGFIGNAQRYELNTNYSNQAIRTSIRVLEIGKTYKVSLKVRFSTSGPSPRFYVYCGSGQTFGAITGNITGNAEYHEFTATATSTNYLQFHISSGLDVGDWFEIDEVNVTQIDTHSVLKHGT